MHKKQKKLLIFSYYFPPSSAAGVFRTVRICRYLKDFGGSAEVITVKRKYYDHAFDSDLERFRIPPKIIVHRTNVIVPMKWAVSIRDQIKTWFKKKNVERINDHSSQAKDRQSWINRWIDPWFQTPDEEIGWVPFAIIRGISIILKNKKTVLYSSGPPHSTHLICVALKKLFGLPWVADFRDPFARKPWDDTSTLQPIQFKIRKKMEDIVIHSADKIIFNTENMLNEFLNYYGGKFRNKFEVIYNGYDPFNFETLDNIKYPILCRFSITHAGSLYGKRDPRPLIYAISMIREKGIILNGDICLNLVGNLSPEFRVEYLVKQLDLGNYINIIPPISYLDCLSILRKSHLLLVIQPKAPLQVPSKLFEYIYLQKPVLALTDAGITATLIKRYKLGEVVDPENVDFIANQIMKYYVPFKSGNLKQNVSKRALADFNGRNLIKKFVDILNQIGG